MLSIVIDQPGDEDCMTVGETAYPKLGNGEIRIEVHAAGVNRADLLQRQGMYPPPPGASETLGLEAAGVVVEIAVGVEVFAIGDRVMALLPGGGYAEEVVVDAGSVMHLPDSLSFEQGAGLAETLLTVFLCVFQLGGFATGEAVLVHGGGSGIGTTTIDLVKRAGGRVIATAGSREKCERCLAIGADTVANYREEAWVEITKKATDGRGVDIVLDSIGAPYLEQNLATLALDGRLVLIGLMGGARSEISLATLLVRRLQVTGSSLRTRSVDFKAKLVAAFLDRFGEDLANGEIQPTIHEVFPLAEAPAAHRLMKASDHFGKIILRVRDGQR